VFGVPQAQMAKAAGLTTIKVGSGDSHRSDLYLACSGEGMTVWLSDGLRQLATFCGYYLRNSSEIVFSGISQYPAPPVRNLARLLQCDKSNAAWGWSDHGEDLSIAFQALTYGCTHLERHFAMPHAGRRSAWDSTPAEFLRLRKYSESVAWEGTPEWQAACDKFLTRWGT
jgi:sialic acid synthase SpsE